MAWCDEARDKLNDHGPVAILNARAPTCLLGTASSQELTRVHVIIENGKLASIEPAGETAFQGPTIDMDDGIIFPCFVDIHTHLDKGHIWPRRSNPDGTFMGALTSVGEDRTANWSAEDVAARIDFSLQCAYHHGSAAIRTHLDSIDKQIGISWGVIEEIRDSWASRIELQAVSLFGIDQMDNEDFLPQILPRVMRAKGILGAVAYPVPRLEEHLDTLFKTAKEHGLNLDFHADETRDPTSDCLLKIAEAANRHNFDGKVLVGHCCSLARQDASTIDMTLDKAAHAGLGVVSLPMCNMYLQDRLYNDGPTTPRWRGVTLLHEMKARGIPVMVASDNTRDPFYAYGDMDVLEVYREATRIAHLDHPVGEWPAAITKTPAEFADFTHRAKLEINAPADIILTRARTWTELLSRPQSDRVVVRKGKAISTELPDYRILDSVVGK